VSVQPIHNEATIDQARAGIDTSGPVPEAPAVSRLHVAGSAVVNDLASREQVLARRTIELQTERAFHVTDVTDHCAQLLAESGIRDGMLSVFSEHTTCAVKINERETCFLEDLRLFMEKLVPAEAYYRHDDLELRDPETLAGAPEDEPINGHAHIKQMLLGASSESVPVVDGELALGCWQRIMFIELDQARPRRIRLQVQGWR
jgi:secondary thiamine-phosphate synthase enzyme